MSELTQTMVPGPSAEAEGPEGHRGDDPGWQGHVQARLASAEDSGVAGPRGRRAGDGGSGRHVPARGATGGLAIPGAGAEGRPIRRRAAQATEATRQSTGGSDRRDGLCSSAGGVRAMDDRPARGRSSSPRRSGDRRQGNGPQSSLDPRAEAVAGKKCGAWQSSTASTSSGWRTC